MQNYKMNSVYVSVLDMSRAVTFYEKLFNKKADRMDKRFSEFHFGDVNFGLYAPKEDGVEITYGSNCVVNFEIEEATTEYERIKDFAPEMDDEIMHLKVMDLFQLKDTEGNILEVYAYTNK
jgi:predicted enzyme related to lactoylglutathione lyase